ncbi:hypothetical protein [Miltoncostaea marina]|uniref:hypothetical protein n=1 Tax=Miltoncostaea marina TaxID=2843215 RepID=UPI001C3C5E44|nr:hypothetical protein [Miltoncostaea marina]
MGDDDARVHRPPRPPTRAASAALAAAATLLAGGCVAVRDVGASQPGGIGDVRVALTICADGAEGCGARDGPTVPEGTPGQVLLGYRVPAGARAPAAPVAQGLTFTGAAGYAAELQRLVPAPAGSRWVGYVSAPTAFAAAALAGGLRVEADFGLQAAAGQPFAGPFAYRPVVGVRSVTAAAPAGRPVACGAAADRPQAEGDAVTICVDAPSLSALRRDLAAGVQDVAVVPETARLPVRAGRFVAVPFRVRHGGRGGRTQLAFSASTSLRGAATATNPATVASSPGQEHAVTVTVGVPAGARAAVHGVTLRATAPGGGARSMTTRIAVAEVVDPLPAARRKTRAVRLDWPRDRRARYYNVQVFRGRAKVASLFPRADRRLVRLRPGRYRVVVWSGIGPMRHGRYADRPWVVRTVRVAPGRTISARARPVPVRLRR